MLSEHVFYAKISDKMMITLCQYKKRTDMTIIKFSGHTLHFYDVKLLLHIILSWVYSL